MIPARGEPSTRGKDTARKKPIVVPPSKDDKEAKGRVPGPKDSVLAKQVEEYSSLTNQYKVAADAIPIIPAETSKPADLTKFNQQMKLSNDLRAKAETKNHSLYSALMDRFEQEDEKERDAESPDDLVPMARYQLALRKHYKAKGGSELKSNELLKSVETYQTKASESEASELDAYGKVLQRYHEEMQDDEALNKFTLNYVTKFQNYAAALKKSKFNHNDPMVVKAHAAMFKSHAELLVAFEKAEYGEEEPMVSPDFTEAAKRTESPTRDCPPSSGTGASAGKVADAEASKSEEETFLKNSEFKGLDRISVEGTVFGKDVAEHRMLPKGAAIITGSGNLAKKGIPRIIHAASGALKSQIKERESNFDPTFEPTIKSVKTSLHNSLLLGKKYFQGEGKGSENGELFVPFIGGKIFAQRIGVHERIEIPEAKKILAKEMVETALEALLKDPSHPPVRFVMTKETFAMFDAELKNQARNEKYKGVGNKVQVYKGSILEDKFTRSKDDGTEEVVTYNNTTQPRVIVNPANMEGRFGTGLSGLICNNVDSQSGPKDHPGRCNPGRQAMAIEEDIARQIHSLNKQARARAAH